jgi:hypothetical protein
MIPTDAAVLQPLSFQRRSAAPAQPRTPRQKWGPSVIKSLAEELRGTGLQTVAILPGPVDTDIASGSGLRLR